MGKNPLFLGWYTIDCLWLVTLLLQCQICLCFKLRNNCIITQHHQMLKQLLGLWETNILWLCNYSSISLIFPSSVCNYNYDSIVECRLEFDYSWTLELTDLLDWSWNMELQVLSTLAESISQIWNFHCRIIHRIHRNNIRLYDLQPDSWKYMDTRWVTLDINSISDMVLFCSTEYFALLLNKIYMWEYELFIVE